MKPTSRFTRWAAFSSISLGALLFTGCQTECHWRAEENPKFSEVSIAANRGDAKAQNDLGVIYLHSHPHDTENAMKWFELSANQGYAPAQYNMGQLYWKGDRHCKCPDYTEALKWFQKAAEQNYPPAFSAIGIAYKTGRSVTQSYKEAMNWFRQAAAYNDPEAEYQLGVLYDNGHEFQANRQEAYKWFILAATQGHPAAIKARENIALKLTREQLDEAQQRALAFTPKSLAPQWQ